MDRTHRMVCVLCLRPFFSSSSLSALAFVLIPFVRHSQPRRTPSEFLPPPCSPRCLSTKSYLPCAAPLLRCSFARLQVLSSSCITRLHLPSTITLSLQSPSLAQLQEQLQVRTCMAADHRRRPGRPTRCGLPSNAPRQSLLPPRSSMYATTLIASPDASAATRHCWLPWLLRTRMPPVPRPSRS
jgi:hypothetical protein